MPEPKVEVDLKPWDHNLIETLNLFNRANDRYGQRMSERRLLELNINLNSTEIMEAIELGLVDKIKDLRKVLSSLMSNI